MSADPTVNGELQYPPVPQVGPVRAIEPRRRLLPALPLSGTALATGGIAAGIVALATLRVFRARRAVRLGRRRRRAVNRIVASRSFLVDVHVLGR
jgi:hypothetical protein